jgi:hypothetical protein
MSLISNVESIYDFVQFTIALRKVKLHITMSPMLQSLTYFTLLSLARLT